MRKLCRIELLAILLCLLFSIYATAQNEMTQWQKSKHADRELPANDVGVWELRQLDTAHCGRCHTEQGFVAWVPQLMRGDPSPLKKPNGQNADEAFIKGLGLTKADVQPITCSACHSEGSKLRITNDIPMLPNGIPVRAAGKGALCMACHNTRNGRTQWDTSDPKKYDQPHDASQADVLLGKNAFFFNDTGSTESPHGAFVGDSCVTCHKALSTGGHQFTPASCDNCHGNKVQKAFVQNGVADLQAQVATAITKRIMATKDKVACVVSWDPKADKNTPNAAVDGKQITAVEIPPGIHGQISLMFTLQNGQQIYSQMGNIKDACGAQGKPVWPTSDPVVRALWNHYLFTYDGSKGVHNPRFARSVLAATLEAISK